MPDLQDYFACLKAEFAHALAAPLSVRKAMLAALLVDAYVDRLFAADPAHDDILRFRNELASASPALKGVFELCAMRLDGPRLVTAAVDVPIANYASLPVEDFMVSLYNDHQVLRVLLLMPDGKNPEVHAVLGEAIRALATLSNLEIRS